MSKPLDELYFEWLYSQVGNVKIRTKSRTYWSLLRQLYIHEYVWIIPNDDNRVEDGRDLRIEFLESMGYQDVDESWMGLGCSFLEMLIAVSRRLEFEDGRSLRDWFWQLLENLELDYLTDALFSEEDTELVNAVMDTVIFRIYQPDGRGGLFPLRYAEEDQRDVELWYQMQLYLLELDDE